MKKSGKAVSGSAVSVLKKKPVRKKQVLPGFFFVYMLEMENGSFYTGYTVDLAARYRKHCSGKGAKFTRAFKPVRIAVCWQTDVRGQAMRAEAFIKSLDKKEKMLLVGKPRLLKKMMRDIKGYDFNVDSLNQRTINMILE